MEVINIGWTVKCHCPICNSYLEIKNNDWSLRHKPDLTFLNCPCCGGVIFKTGALKEIEQRLNKNYGKR